MKLQELKTLINSIENNNIETIKVEKNGSKITINKEKVKNIAKTKKHKSKIVNIIPTTTNQKEEENNIEQAHLYSTIVSPMVGTFYASPAPNEPAFIEIGEIVKSKQTVCIIEAMKLMNEIESEVNGEIIEILVKNGDIVDCGQALIKIKKNHK